MSKEIKETTNENNERQVELLYSINTPLTTKNFKQITEALKYYSKTNKINCFTIKSHIGDKENYVTITYTINKSKDSDYTAEVKKNIKKGIEEIRFSPQKSNHRTTEKNLEYKNETLTYEVKISNIAGRVIEEADINKIKTDFEEKNNASLYIKRIEGRYTLTFSEKIGTPKEINLDPYISTIKEVKKIIAENKDNNNCFVPVDNIVAELNPKEPWPTTI